jgi:hypothetical protein
VIVTLKFELPDEREELELHQRGPAAHHVLWTLARELKSVRKYEEGHSGEALAMADRIETLLYREAGEEGIDVCC